MESDEPPNSKRPMPFSRKVIARPKDYLPSQENTRVIGAFNAAAATIETPNGLEMLLLVRVAETYSKKDIFRFHLPYFNIPHDSNSPLIDFDVYGRRDFRRNKKEVRLPDKSSRLTHISLPRILRLDMDGKILKRSQKPAMLPQSEYERFGLEDYRITQMEDGGYLVTYVCPHRKFGVSTVIKKTNDFETFKDVFEKNTSRPTIRGKDVAPFPKKFPSTAQTECVQKEEELYAALKRPNSFSDISSPGICVAYSPDLVHWGQEHRLTEEGEITGTGTPLIRTDGMWWGPYHRTYLEKHFPKDRLKYDTHLMGVDSSEPWKNYRTSGMLLTREDYREILPKDGFVPGVVTTFGRVEIDGITHLFSGIDDSWQVMDSFHSEDLIKFLKAS